MIATFGFDRFDIGMSDFQCHLPQKLLFFLVLFEICSNAMVSPTFMGVRRSSVHSDREQAITSPVPLQQKERPPQQFKFTRNKGNKSPKVPRGSESWRGRIIQRNKDIVLRQPIDHEKQPLTSRVACFTVVSKRSTSVSEFRIYSYGHSIFPKKPSFYQSRVAGTLLCNSINNQMNENDSKNIMPNDQSSIALGKILMKTQSSSEFVRHVIIAEPPIPSPANLSTISVAETVSYVLAQEATKLQQQQQNLTYVGGNNNMQHGNNPFVLVDNSLLTNQTIKGENEEANSVGSSSGKDHFERAMELITLGSILYMPSSSSIDKSWQEKPKRLRRENATLKLSPGDYLRVHFNPRRFPAVHWFEWDAPFVEKEKVVGNRRSGESSSRSTLNNKEGVIVAENESKGWLVINKPAKIPVHMTVDNAVENAQACLAEARRRRRFRQQQSEQSSEEPQFSPNDSEGKDCYVSVPQRLDQNTSGLLVLATSKAFSAYFANLLQQKTHQKLAVDADHNYTSKQGSESWRVGEGIRKVYKCLVCLIPTNATDLYQQRQAHFETSHGHNDNRSESENEMPISADISSSANRNRLNTPLWSVAKAMQFLTTSKNMVIRHWLEPSIRAPKRFVDEPPNLSISDEEVSANRSDTIGETTKTIRSRQQISRIQPGQNVTSAPSLPWLESLLVITNVGTPFALVGNRAGQTLAGQLWGRSTKGPLANVNIDTAMPDQCQAVVELQIELLTGRTHQIRGQLAALGFPIVGDAQYGGAKQFTQSHGEDESSWNSNSKNNIVHIEQENSVDRLALQCQQLEFLDPDLNENELQLTASLRWNRFQLNQTWWTPFLDQFQNDNSNCLDDSSMTMYFEMERELGSLSISEADNRSVERSNSNNSNNYQTRQNNRKKRKRLGPEFLPKRVQLSPGRNKYILLRAFCAADDDSDEDEEYWFVKSATPEECEGPYHGNVAQDLREWVEAAGYQVKVTGGGRIDYQPVLTKNSTEDDKCVVYGFSYGFGKGDHEFAAKLIREYTGIPATFDNTDGIY